VCDPTSPFRGASRRVRKFALALVWTLPLISLLISSFAAAQTAAGFSPQRRLGYTTGDQWEPAMAADGRGHIYVLYPQYGPVPGCASCSAPAITLLVSSNNGNSWQPSRTMAPLATGQFDPQIVVDPVDRQTVYASWLQNNKRDIVVARSLDAGKAWSFSVAERRQDDADKPVLAVRGTDVYVGFNHDEKYFVAASHDAGQTFTTVNVNPSAERGSSLAGGATVDAAGNVYFGWTFYARQQSSSRPVNVYVSRSSDGGRSWTTSLLDVSGAPPECEAEGCDSGYLGPQIALASDPEGALYALWNAGAANGGPERIYFASSTNGGASWSTRADVSTAPTGVENCFPTIAAGASGDIRIAWMDARVTDSPANGSSRHLWNTFYRSSTNGGATWSAEAQLSGPARGYDYILPTGFKFPFGDYFSLAIDSQGATHAVWGAGRNYKSPGSIWYTRGR